MMENSKNVLIGTLNDTWKGDKEIKFTSIRNDKKMWCNGDARPNWYFHLKFPAGRRFMRIVSNSIGWYFWNVYI